MKVWVLQAGRYEDKVIWGVFSSAEKAMAAWQPQPTPASLKRIFSSGHDIKRTYEWIQDDDGDWIFDADWDDHGRLFEYEIDTK